MGDSQFSRILELKAEAEKRHLEFLKLEIETGLIFARTSAVEVASGNLPHAARAAANARKAYNVVEERLPAIEGLNEKDRAWFAAKMKELLAAMEPLPG